jgi:hypothetical protein
VKNSDWPRAEVKRLAQSSGKPLEVQCAQVFLAAGWTARLSSHFADRWLETERELDILAIKEDVVKPWDLPFRLRLLISCRGFPPGRSPLTYSVTTSNVPSFAPRLVSTYRSRQGFGLLPDLESASASQLLLMTSLNGARPLIAFDMIERNETARRNSGKGQSEPTVSYQRCGDRQLLFPAVDSCIKAAFYWSQEDYHSVQPSFVSLNVPVCVLGLPFWDVCIDGGTVAEPELLRRGYLTDAYPSQPSFRQVTTFVWAAEDLRSLVAALDNLFCWFRDQLSKPELARDW